jgi:Protein of unknown function (DUF1549)/Protein of unknown function (DUF1553)
MRRIALLAKITPYVLGIATLLICLKGSARDIAPISFELQVQPIMAARGCSTGPCHGKQRGQNGFQLSLFGFDSDFDYAALTKNARGRRIFPAAPEQSLLLLKATGQAPHGGGQRIAVDGDEYRILLDWIESGTPRRVPNEKTLTAVSASPTERFLKPGESLPLKVTAHYSDGSEEDVTRMAMFQSNESAIVSVGEDGVIKAGPISGEASIMARYLNVIATCNVAIPLAGEVPDELYAKLPRNNFIDELAWNKLQSLGITPSAPIDDAKFMRRVYIDIIGTLPAPNEVREFLADTSEDKRTQLIDRLLNRPEYAEHWANKWADLLRPNPYRVGIKAVLNYDYWIRDSFRKNKPYDQFARELISAKGSTWHNGAATLFRDRRSPDEMTTMVTQLFLGIRLECAKCHHHVFEKWSQEDFYSFAAYFSRVGYKGTGLSPPISGGEEIVLTKKSGSVSHPLTGKVLEPRPLFSEAPPIDPESDPRDALAAWVTSKDNYYFSQVMVNRIWADLMGRGLVVPVDDLRATNPPTNGPLLEALAKDFGEKNFDIKEVIRTITSSYLYSLGSEPTDRNIADTQNYSRHYRQRLRAEVMLDAIADITDVPNKFAAMPAGSHAKEIWTHRVTSLFLDTFGRPDPNQDPPCERQEDATVTQTLHMMNATELHARVTSKTGRATQLADSDKTPEQIVDELYLLVYARFPDSDERQFGKALFDAPADKAKRKRATEDLLWALLNTPEFLFKD